MKRFSAMNQAWRLSAALAVLCLLYSPKVWAGSAKSADPSVKQMLRQVEQRLDTVEQENRSLREQVVELKQQVSTTAPTVSAMQQHMTQVMPRTEQRVTNIEKSIEASDQQLASLKQRTDSPFKGSGLGFRSGWSEVPFDLPGGFYWDMHLGHRLFEERDGIPWGDINGELAIGLIQGNQKSITLTTLAGTPLQHPVNTQDSVSLVTIAPTVRYTLRRLEPFEPTVFAGPEILINLFEARPLNAGQLPLPPELRKKGIPTIGSGHVFAGGVFGANLQYRLSDIASALNIPASERFFSKITLGPEWRYHVMENGENFQSYSGEITIGF
jgi:hypothetical protein